MTNLMGAFCVSCGTKNMTGFQTGDQLLVRYPNGCHMCSRNTRKGTNIKLAELIEKLGYAFVDMEGQPLRPSDTIQRGEIK